LVCKELEKVPRRKAKSFLDTVPSSLGRLYDRMWEKLQERDVDDVRICQKILCTITLAFRPFHLKEIQVIVEEIESEGLEAYRELIEICGSFVTIRDNDFKSI
jgi:hypothetical protein